MITLKEALTYSKNELESLKKELNERAKKAKTNRCLYRAVFR